MFKIHLILSLFVAVVLGLAVNANLEFISSGGLLDSTSVEPTQANSLQILETALKN